MTASPMTAEQRPFVPMLRCPCCGLTDRTTLCHSCGKFKLPRYVAPYASELTAQELAVVVS